MRSNWDSFVISAMIQKLKAIGFRKRFLQDSQQFIYDSILSYQKAAEECLPYIVLAGPKNHQGHTHCWAGFGLYVGWYGGLAITDFFRKRTGDLDGVVLIINIEPFSTRLAIFSIQYGKDSRSMIEVSRYVICECLILTTRIQ
jgi:hypothetical protein